MDGHSLDICYFLSRKSVLTQIKPYKKRERSCYSYTMVRQKKLNISYARESTNYLVKKGIVEVNNNIYIVILYWPSAHVLRGVASLRLLVVDLSDLAAEVPGLNAVQAHVEALAVSRVRELGVGHGQALGVNLLVLGALETVGLRLWKGWKWC